MGLVSAHHEHGPGYARPSPTCRRCRRPPTRPRSPIPAFSPCWAQSISRPTSLKSPRACWSARPSSQIAAGGQPSVSLQLQLAAIYLLRNNTAQAYDIYQQVLTAQSGPRRCLEGPDCHSAWPPTATAEALQQISLIPAPVRKQLESGHRIRADRGQPLRRRRRYSPRRRLHEPRAGPLRQAEDAAAAGMSTFRTPGCSSTPGTTAPSIRR